MCNNVKTYVKDNRIFQQDSVTVTNTFHSCTNDKGDKINKSILESLVTHRRSLPPHCSVSSVYA